QMPGGVPTATVSIGKSGAKNDGILAAQSIGTNDAHVAEKLTEYREQMQAKIAEMRNDHAKKKTRDSSTTDDRDYRRRPTWAHDGSCRKVYGLSSRRVRSDSELPDSSSG